ncbi:uncharacterized protein [Eurosta solidaginis]|uniref:uncharacterized protein n=1 Tax=Eurosta solidaginis TaxID=178769 RepID=UPI0035314C88
MVFCSRVFDLNLIMDDFCGKCDKGFGRTDNTCVPCNGFCKKRFHRACCEGAITEYDVRLIKSNYHIRYMCAECVNAPIKVSKAFDSVLASQKLGLEAIMTAFEVKFRDLSTQIDGIKNLICCNQAVNMEDEKSSNKDKAKEKASSNKRSAKNKNKNNKNNRDSIGVLAAEIGALKAAVSSCTLPPKHNNDAMVTYAMDLCTFSPVPSGSHSQCTGPPLNTPLEGSQLHIADNASAMLTPTPLSVPIPPSFSSIVLSPSAVCSDARLSTVENSGAANSNNFTAADKVHTVVPQTNNDAVDTSSTSYAVNTNVKPSTANNISVNLNAKDVTNKTAKTAHAHAAAEHIAADKVIRFDDVGIAIFQLWL